MSPMTYTTIHKVIRRILVPFRNHRASWRCKACDVRRLIRSIGSDRGCDLVGGIASPGITHQLLAKQISSQA